MEPVPTTEMVDRIVAERYRLDDVVGVGRLAAVFRAWDRITDTHVALKIFDHALAGDERFTDRLMAALERVADVEHPNLVEITDWGVDESPFIVSELCEGGSLADMLDSGNTLDPSQALVVALQCARALNACHANDLIHRDITPRNVLFTKDQQVRLSDAGLSEILGSAPVPQAARALENVRYASPEQARSRPVDGSTDMYSLALVMSEAVSNVAPHVADTVVGTLMDRAESAARLEPALGLLLGALERCGRIAPGERPQAEELAISLLATAETLPRPTPMVLPGLRTKTRTDSALRFAAGVASDQPEGDRKPDSDAGDTDSGETGVAAEEPGVGSNGGDGPTAGRSPDEGIDEEHGDDDGASVAIPDEPVAGIVLADDDRFASDVQVSVPGVELATGDSASAETSPADRASQVGSSDSDRPPAESSDSELSDDGSDDFNVSSLGALDDLDAFSDDSFATEYHEGGREVEAEPDDPIVAPPGAESGRSPGSLEDLDRAEPVFASPVEPSNGNSLDVPESAQARRSGSTYEGLEDDADDRLPWWPLVLLGLLVAAAIAASVWFFVLDTSTESAAVPDLIGVPFDELDERLAGRDWDIERLENRLDGSTVGSVISQSPEPGGDLDAGETLSVTVSLGNAMVEIPSDLVGLSVDQAASRLGAVGLSLGALSEVDSESLDAGLVVGLNEPTTQMPSGEPVDLRVSSGPQDRIVPANLVGIMIGEATTELVGQRLQPVEERVFDPEAPVGTVLGIDPPPGTVVPADSVVTLLVSDGPEPVIMPDIVGLTLEEAVDAITELGLIWIDEEGTPGEPVIGSLPPIGAEVEVGTEVTIILDEPDPDEE